MMAILNIFRLITLKLSYSFKCSFIKSEWSNIYLVKLVWCMYPYCPWLLSLLVLSFSPLSSRLSDRKFYPIKWKLYISDSVPQHLERVLKPLLLPLVFRFSFVLFSFLGFAELPLHQNATSHHNILYMWSYRNSHGGVSALPLVLSASCVLRKTDLASVWQLPDNQMTNVHVYITIWEVSPTQPRAQPISFSILKGAKTKQKKPLQIEVMWVLQQRCIT